MDDAIKYLISSGYINQSRNKIIDKVDNPDAKWLLDACEEYKKRTGNNIQLKRDGKNHHIKAKILHQLFNNLIDEKIAQNIVKYSSLI